MSGNLDLSSFSRSLNAEFPRLCETREFGTTESWFRKGIPDDESPVNPVIGWIHQANFVFVNFDMVTENLELDFQ